MTRQTVFSLLGCVLLAQHAAAEVRVVIVEGLAGADRYEEPFDRQVALLEAAAESLAQPENIRVFRSAEARREEILAYFGELAAESAADDRLLVYLVGHGSYDDHDYKFNIPGPDLTDTDIGEALGALPAEDRLLVVTGSASGALADRLAGAGLTLVLATRSGIERHATRFGTYFSAALADTAADTDKNEIITADEAFSYAERMVDDYYEREGRLATEHPRLEGEGAARFALARIAAARPLTFADDELARLVEERDALNADIDTLRLRRDEMPAEDYRAELLELMLELARVEDTIEAREQEAKPGD